MLFFRTLMANRPRLTLCRPARFALALSLAVASPAPLAAQTFPPPSPPVQTPLPNAAPDEMRGLWVVRDSLTSPAAVRQVVATAEKYHLNALFVQVRGRGDAWYDSALEPRAEPLTKQPRDFDPLRMVIEEAHARGIQVHAWLNTFLAWSGPRTPKSPQHVWNAHRDWFARDAKGRVSSAVTARSEGAFLSPAHPEAREHLFRVFTDVALRYDVDGVHFDYVRYGGPEYDFGPVALARFREYMVGQVETETIGRVEARRNTDRLAWVHAFPNEWAEWRRDQVTALVSRVAEAVRAEKPEVQVSAAVFADARDAHIARGQDWGRWLREGNVDFVALMAYGKGTERIVAQTRAAIEASGGRGQVITGLGAWRLSAHDVAQKIAAVRSAGASGVNLFSYNGVSTKPQYLETLRRGVFASRAAPPRGRFRRMPVAPETAPREDKAGN